MGNFVENNIDLQSIDFQRSSLFFNDLVNNIKELSKENKKEMHKSKKLDDLEAVFKHHTGLSIGFDVQDIGAGPCINVPFINRNSIFLNGIMRNWIDSQEGIDLIEKAGNKTKGIIDLKNGKVSGIFSDPKFQMHMPKDFITDSRYEPEELAAIVLHETGHAFTFLEFFNRTITTNQVLAGISKGIDKSTNNKEKEIILIAAKRALNLEDLNTEELSKAKDNKTIEAIIITNINKSLKSNMNNSVYDQNSWEYLCDQFAARQGAGRYLATGLEKLFKQYHFISFRSTPMYFIMEACKLLLIITTFATLSLPLIPLIAFISLELILGNDGHHPSYDKPIARINRIKNQLTEALKEKDLTEDESKKIQEDFKILKAITNEYSDRRQLFDYIIDSIFKRNAVTQIKLQQDLENLIANDLFVKASELKFLKD